MECVIPLNTVSKLKYTSMKKLNKLINDYI